MSPFVGKRSLTAPCGRSAESMWHRPGDHFCRPRGRAREQRVAGEDLGQDAGQAPHVNRRPVRQPEQHLRRAVEAALDVGVQPLVLEAAAAEVDDLRRRAAARSRVRAARAWTTAAPTL